MLSSLLALGVQRQQDCRCHDRLPSLSNPLNDPNAKFPFLHAHAALENKVVTIL